MYKCEEVFQVLSEERIINQVYNRLYVSFGSQEWWPGDTPFEVILGAILTQAVNWSNVEKAITNLKKEGILDPDSIYRIDESRLAGLIKPSGYYNVKAKKVKAFTEFLFNEFKGDLNKMFKLSLEELRPELLNVYGIGPETADSILLYAGNYRTFVIDAYTIRVFSRFNLVDAGISYDDFQEKFHHSLPESIEVYNEYHALLVKLGKDICKKNKPQCNICPIWTAG